MSPRRADQIVLTLPRDPALSPLVRMATAHFLRRGGLAADRARRLAGTVETSCRIDLRRGGRVGSGRGGGLVLSLCVSSDLCEGFIRTGRSRTWRSVLHIPRPPVT